MKTIKVKETHSPKHFIGLMQKVFNVEQVPVGEIKLQLMRFATDSGLPVGSAIEWFNTNVK